MASDTKKKVVLSFEEDELLEFRKRIFRKGLSMQEFFAYVMHSCVMNDESAEYFYEGALETKQQIIEKGDELKDVKLSDVDAMYDAIENRLNNK